MCHKFEEINFCLGGEATGRIQFFLRAGMNLGPRIVHYADPFVLVSFVSLCPCFPSPRCSPPSRVKVHPFVAVLRRPSIFIDGAPPNTAGAVFSFITISRNSLALPYQHPTSSFPAVRIFSPSSCIEHH